ncbi:hypothetical protein EON83_21300 [bacterium]|nr:MAG: hypothetical protein EON83_21300 [bacterium]
MKKSTFFRIAILSAVALSVSTFSAQAAPAAKAGGAAGQKGPKRVTAVKHAELINGKPLTDAQKTAIRAAQKARMDAIKPIQEKYKASVAKALGITVAQLEAKDKALRAKKDN